MCMKRNNVETAWEWRRVWLKAFPLKPEAGLSGNAAQHINVVGISKQTRDSSLSRNALEAVDPVKEGGCHGIGFLMANPMVGLRDGDAGKVGRVGL